MAASIFNILLGAALSAAPAQASQSTHQARSEAATAVAQVGIARAVAEHDGLHAGEPLGRTTQRTTAAGGASAVSGLDAGFAPAGLYPIWEGTGWVLPHRRGLFTTSHAEIGVGDTVQIGLRPTALAMRVPNIHVKVRLPTGIGSLHAAVAGGAYVLLPGAAEAFFSPSFATRLDALDSTAYAAPASFNLTWQPLDWLAIHNTLTAMLVGGEAPVKTEVTTGDFASAEVLLYEGHSFFAHGGAIGLTASDSVVAGASYRYATDWLEVRLGYFYRHSRAGMQRQPLVSAGFVL